MPYKLAEAMPSALKKSRALNTNHPAEASGPIFRITQVLVHHLSLRWITSFWIEIIIPFVFIFCESPANICAVWGFPTQTETDCLVSLTRFARTLLLEWWSLRNSSGLQSVYQGPFWLAFIGPKYTTHLAPAVKTKLMTRGINWLEA